MTLNLNLGTPLSQGGSHAVMPSLGHGTGLPYREGETPARAPINSEPLQPRVFLGSRREPRCPRKARSKVASA